VFSIGGDMVGWDIPNEYETQAEAEAVAIIGTEDDSVWSVYCCGYDDLGDYSTEVLARKCVALA